MMPGRWVVRRSVYGKLESEPLRGFLRDDIAAALRLRTVEQCVALLTQEDETCVGDGEYRLLFRDGQVIGHIETTHENPSE